MACPYFYPAARFESDSWAIPPRLPLGDAYAGECRASNQPFQPDESQVREVCNLGYGRGRCSRFPADAKADAVRFHIAEDGAALIRIQYVFEKDCWPQSHGLLDCVNPTGDVSSGPEDPILRKQAVAFAASYARRR